MEKMLNKYLNDLKNLMSSSSSSSDLNQLSTVCELIALEYYHSNNYKECRGFLEKALQLRTEYLKNDELNELLIDITFRVLYVLRKESEHYSSDKTTQSYSYYYEKCLVMRGKYDSTNNNSKENKTKAVLMSDDTNKLNDLYLMDSTMIYCLEAEKKIIEQDYNEAENLYKFCLRLRIDKYGPESSAVAMVLYPYAEMLAKIGFHYSDIKVITEAIEYFERSMNINISEYGKYHKSINNCLIRLVAIYREKWEKFGSENDLLSSKSLAIELLSVQENIFGTNSLQRTDTLSLINSINQEIENLGGTFLLRNKTEYNSSSIGDSASIPTIVLKYLIKTFERLTLDSKVDLERELAIFTHLSVQFGSESPSTQNKLIEVSNNILYWGYSNIFYFNDYSQLDLLNKLLNYANEYGSNYLTSVIGFEINRLLATFYFIQGNFMMAIKQLNAAVSNCPQSHNGYFISGMADALLFLTESYSKIGRHDDALHSARLATDIAQRRVESLQKSLKSNGDIPNTKEIGLFLDCYSSVFLTYCSLAQELEKNKIFKLSSEWYQRALENANYFEVDSSVKEMVLLMIQKAKISNPEYSNDLELKPKTTNQDYFENHQNRKNDVPSILSVNSRARPQSAMPRLIKYNLSSDNSSVEIFEKDSYDNNYKKNSQPFEEGDEGQSLSQYGMNDIKVRPKSAVSKLGGGYSSSPTKRNSFQFQNYPSDDLNSFVNTQEYQTNHYQLKGGVLKNNFVDVEKTKEEIIYKHIEKMRQTRNVIFNIDSKTNSNKLNVFKSSQGKMQKKDLVDFDKSPYNSSHSATFYDDTNIGREDNHKTDYLNKNYLPPPQSYKYLRTVAAKSAPLIFQTYSNLKTTTDQEPSKKRVSKADPKLIEIDEYFDSNANEQSKNNFPFIDGMKVEARRSFKILGVRSKWYTGRVVSGVFAKGCYDIHFDNGDKEKGIHVDNIRVFDHRKTISSIKSTNTSRNKTPSINLNISKYNNFMSIREEMTKEMRNITLKVLSGVNGRENKRKIERLRVKTFYATKIQAMIRGSLLRFNFFHIRNILEREKLLRKKELELFRKETFLSQSYNNFVQNVNQFEMFMQQKQTDKKQFLNDQVELELENYNIHSNENTSPNFVNTNKTLETEPSISVESVDTLPKHIKSREIRKLKNDIETMQSEQRRLLNLEDERFKNIQFNYNQLFNELTESKIELQRLKTLEMEKKKTLKEASYHSIENILDSALKQNSIGSNSIFNEFGKVKIDDFWENNDNKLENHNGNNNNKSNSPNEFINDEFFERVQNLESSFLNNTILEASVESQDKLFRLSEIEPNEEVEILSNNDIIDEITLIKKLSNEAINIHDNIDYEKNGSRIYLCISKINAFDLKQVEMFDRNDNYLLLYFSDCEPIKTSTFINSGTRAFWDFGDNSFIRFPTSIDSLKSEKLKIVAYDENKLLFDIQIGFGEVSLLGDLLNDRENESEIIVDLYNTTNQIVGRVSLIVSVQIEEEDNIDMSKMKLDNETEKYMSSSNLLSLLPNKDSVNTEQESFNNRLDDFVTDTIITTEVMNTSDIMKHLIEMKIMCKEFPLLFYLDNYEDSMLQTVKAKDQIFYTALSISCNVGHKLLLKLKDSFVPHFEIYERDSSKRFMYFFPSDIILDTHLPIQITIIKQEIIKYLHPKERKICEEINEKKILELTIPSNPLLTSNSWLDYMSTESHSLYPTLICEGYCSVINWGYLLYLLKTLWRNYSEWTCQRILLLNNINELIGSIILEVALTSYGQRDSSGDNDNWRKKLSSAIKTWKESFLDILKNIQATEAEIKIQVEKWQFDQRNDQLENVRDDKNYFFENIISKNYEEIAKLLYENITSITSDQILKGDTAIIDLKSIDRIGEDFKDRICNLTEKCLKTIKIHLNDLDNEKTLSAFCSAEFQQVRKNIEMYEWKTLSFAVQCCMKVIGQDFMKQITEEVKDIFNWSSLSDSINDDSYVNNNNNNNNNNNLLKIYGNVERAAKNIKIESLKSLIDNYSRKI